MVSTLSIPEAFISHQTPGRVRIKIPSKKENESYFSSLRKAFSQLEDLESVKLNPLTSSALFVGSNIDAECVAEHGEKTRIFRLVEKTPQGAVLPRQVIEPLRSLNRSFGQLTGGEIDFAGILFLTLLVVGALQILRGNFRSMPWYTAYWYAFGIFRSLIDNKNRN